jgi:hypothetical protein
MTFDEALRWLDERGGMWNARASETSFAVNVRVGTVHVRTPVPELKADDVRSAVIRTVRLVQDMQQAQAVFA